MLRKTLIGSAAAALIAAGATVAATGTASASGITVSGPNFAIGFGTPGFYPKPFPPRQVCQPVFKTVQFWKWGKDAYLANPVYSRDFPPAKYIGQ